MESFYLALSVVFPLFFMMAVGAAVKKIHMVDDHSLTVMNTLTFRVFIPVLIFLNVYHLDPGSLFTADNMKMLLITAISVFLVVLIFHRVFRHLPVSEERRAVLLQGVYRSNLALFGLPVLQSIYGEANSGSIYILIVFIIPIYNILAVIILEGMHLKNISIKILLQHILKNPLVDASMLGAVFCFGRIHLPALLLTSLESLSKVATPLAFVVLGATLQVSSLRKNSRAIALVSLFRLVLIPGIVIGAACLAGLRQIPLVAMLGCVASPVAVSSFSMAKEMGKEPELAGELVASTSVISIFTIFCWIVLLRNLQLI